MQKKIYPQSKNNNLSEFPLVLNTRKSRRKLEQTLNKKRAKKHLSQKINILKVIKNQFVIKLWDYISDKYESYTYNVKLINYCVIRKENTKVSINDRRLFLSKKLSELAYLVAQKSF